MHLPKLKVFSFNRCNFEFLKKTLSPEFKMVLAIYDFVVHKFEIHEISQRLQTLAFYDILAIHDFFTTRLEKTPLSPMIHSKRDRANKIPRVLRDPYGTSVGPL